MRYARLFIHSVLLFTMPAMVAYPHKKAHAKTAKTSKHSRDKGRRSFHKTNPSVLTYDELMNFINEVEKTDLEKCSPEKLEEINLRLAQLAKAGFVANEHCGESDLDNDIQELLYGEGSPSEFAFAFGYDSDYVFAPANTADWQWEFVFFPYKRPHKCLKVKYYNNHHHKNVCSRVWKHTRNFIDKHKTAIFIGAVVVAATVAIVLTAGGASPYVAPAAADAIAGITAAGGAGAAAASSANRSGDGYFSNRESLTSIRPSEGSNIPNALDLSIGRALDQRFMQEECIASIKELLSENEPIQTLRQSNSYQEPGSAEFARGIASSLIHELYDEVASYIPPPLDLPKLDWNSSEDRQFSPMETREQAIAAGHQLIDQVFSTNLAVQFAPETKAINKTVIGIIPLPGASGTVSVSRNTGKIAGTQATAVRGWSPGQPYTNLTAAGDVPRWSTVRARYWKNRAYSHSAEYKPQELERMKQGLAPQRTNRLTGQKQSMELHHDPAQKDGGLFDFVEVWPDEHALIDKYRYMGS